MQPLRRKSPLFLSVALRMNKHGGGGGGGRKNSNLSVVVVMFSVFLFGCFMYNEDVKSIAEFPFSSPKSQEIHDEVRGKTDQSDNLAHQLNRIDDDEGGLVKNSRTIVEKEVEESSIDHNEKQENAALKSNFVKEEEDAEEEQKIELPVEEEEEEAAVELPPEDCDLFDGQWVFDNITHPIYKEHECEFLTAQVTCLRNGRQNSLYQNWRWQPRACSLPSKIITGEAEKQEANVCWRLIEPEPMGINGLSGSINRSSWPESLNKTGALSVFKIEDYNATVEFYWAPFLVESNSDDPNMHSILNRIIMPESIQKHGKNWKNVDYLIFNTYIWWMNTFAMKILKGSFDEGATEYEEIERPVAYTRVLNTWSKWVNQNINPNHTQVFFMSMSPLHIKSLDWENPDGIKCAKETTPILNTSMPLNVGTDRRLFVIAANVTKSMEVPVYFLNITTLSEYRKDAHTSVHTIRQGKMLTVEQQADPATYADCIHWCLPGLPDTWNEFLYTKIISRPDSKFERIFLVYL